MITWLVMVIKHVTGSEDPPKRIPAKITYYTTEGSWTYPSQAMKHEATG